MKKHRPFYVVSQAVGKGCGLMSASKSKEKTVAQERKLCGGLTIRDERIAY